MIIDRIRELCKLHNITIQKLEEATGIANGIIAKWGIASPKAKNLEKVADYFGVSVDYLLEREETKLPPDIMELAAQINDLPLEAQAAIIHQVKAFAALDKK